MADNSSDSESSITGWTVVNDAGECDVSDSASTSSSLEFVQLEETAALYQRRVSDHGKGSGKQPAVEPEESNKTPEETDMIPEETDKTPQETDNIPEGTVNIPEETDDTPEETDNTPEDAVEETPIMDTPVEVTEDAPETDGAAQTEVPDLSSVSTPESLGPLDTTSAYTEDPSPSPTENESEPPQEEEDVTFEPLTHDPSDDLDQDPTPQSVPQTEVSDNPHPEPQPGTSSQDDNAFDDMALEQNHQIELLHAALVRQESDSDSDFVKLDLLPGESGDQPALLADVARLMQISGASGTSDTSRASSSISANFRFVNPPIAPTLQPRRPEEEEEEDSLNGEFDDRCESDISGVATDDTDDSDLSSMIYSLDDVPLIAGRRLYRHRPNPSLNSVLTVISLVALFLAIGVAVGHYIGVSRDGWLRKMQVERMKGAQDSHLICLKQADVLKGKIRKLTTNQGFDTGAAPPGGRTGASAGGSDLFQKSVGGPTGQQPVFSQLPSDHQIQLNPDDKRPTSETMLGQPESVPNKLNKLEKESETEAELKKYIQVLRNELNRAQMENADLRAEVTRLRYTAHPANAHVSAEVTQQQLKVKVNQLASENDDLKSAVGKMRYTVLPSNVEEITDGSNSTEDTSLNVSTSLKDVAALEQKLENVSLELVAERKMNQYLHGIVASKSKTAEKETTDAPLPKTPSTVLSCVRQHLPGVVSLSAKYIDQAGHTTQEYWAKLNEATKGTTGQIVDKWNELIKLVGSTKIEDLKLPEEMEKLLQLAWKVEETIKNTVTGVDENNNSEPENKSSTSNGNISKPTMAHFQDYVNKTKLNMSKLSNTLQETWQKVKNLSKDLLANPEDTVQKVHDKLREQVTVIGEEIKTKWNEVKGKIHPKHWMDEKKKPHHHKHHQHPKHHHEKHHRHHPKHDKKTADGDYSHRQSHQEQERSEERPPFGDTPKPSEDKPQHKQRQSSHEQYNEFWKKTEYDPDDFFHEGFFEGNQREWRKHQKRLNYLHGRIHRLNEDILYSMDDDDIEDIYDDLDDLEDDLEDEDQPKTLQTWLACQVRWWKSRLHRKHRSENLIKGCGQQIMQWQLRALCKEPCYGKKCGKKRASLAAHPLCQRILQSQDNLCQHNGQASQCHRDIRAKNVHSIPSQKAKDLKHSQDKIAKPTSHHPAASSHTPTMPSRRVQLPNDDHLFTMEPATSPNSIEDKANNTAWDDDEEEVIPPSSPKDVPASPKSSGDRVAEQSSDSDASWIFERAVLREYHHHNPDWVFERAAERDLERNKPWYVSRSEEREYRRVKKQYDEDVAP